MKRLSIMSLVALGLISNIALIAGATQVPAAATPAQENTKVPAQSNEDDQEDEDVIIMEDEEDNEDQS